MLSLVGQYDSPFVRRVAVSLTVLELPFERQPLSVFADAEALRAHNPLGRVPALLLEDGACLIDSWAILDHLDERVGPQRALLPAAGVARREALQTVVLATGICDKTVASVYERRREPSKIDLGWIGRYRDQIEAGLGELDQRAALQLWPPSRLLQPVISIAAMFGFIRLYLPEAAPVGRFAALDRLAAWAEGQPALIACRPSVAELGGPPELARAALLRLQGSAQSR
jgi:glutathione S-transferase